MPVRLHLERGAIEIETAVEIMVALAIVLIPKNTPLREEMGAVGVARVVGYGPRKQLAA